MINSNNKVDSYLIEGCGRCPLGGTPGCKVNNWREELKRLRSIILDCGLTEELKWDVPCYTFQKKNILILAAFKEHCAVSFFKGALLKDAGGILRLPGENTQSVRLIRFVDTKEIVKREQMVRSYIFEAIEVEKAGLKVELKKTSKFNVPEEFKNKLKRNPALKTAFYALTPGRQRGYLLYFSSAKQAKTREQRIEKLTPRILQGKGMID